MIHGPLILRIQQLLNKLAKHLLVNPLLLTQEHMHFFTYDISKYPVGVVPLLPDRLVGPSSSHPEITSESIRKKLE